MQQHFDSLFPRLDRSVYPLELYHLFYKDFVSFAEVLSRSRITADRVLSVGSVSAFEFLAIRHVLSAVTIDAVDRSKPSLEGVDRFIQADILSLKFPPIYGAMVLRHFPINTGIAPELLRILAGGLKDSGTIIATFYYQHEFESFREWASAQSLRIIAARQNPTSLELDEHLRHRLRGTPVIMNSVAAEEHYEISSRDKWYVYAKK